MPILHGDYLKRTGVFVGSADIRRKMVYPCSNGHISILIMGGAGGGASTKALINWMAEKGFAAEWMISKDWVGWVPGLFMKPTERDLVALMLGAARERRSETGAGAERAHR